MKFVIDISEEEYARIQSMDWKNGDRIYDEAERAIHYGKPLEKVLGEIKGEINKKISHYDHFSSSNTAHGLEMALEIIDKHLGNEKEV